MAQHAELRAEPRDMIGKKVRRLRRAGILPATVYGHNVTPQSIQVDARTFRHLLRSEGRTQLIDLVIGEERARPVFIKQTTVDAKRNELLHVEFFQANLREKVTAHVPVHQIGESQAVREGGILLTVLDHVDVEALPDDVPAALEVDISTIAEINGSVLVGELSAPPGVTVLTPADEVVVKVDPPVAEEVVEEAVEVTEPLPDELGGEEAPPDSVPEA